MSRSGILGGILALGVAFGAATGFSFATDEEERCVDRADRETQTVAAEEKQTQEIRTVEEQRQLDGLIQQLDRLFADVGIK